MTDLKIDLTDCTICIPTMIVDNERFRNLCIALSYINKFFDVNIIIAEQTSHQGKNIAKKFNATYLRLNDEQFHKTKLLNLMYNEAKTDIIVSYDMDVLFPPCQYEMAANMLRDKKADACYSYDGRFYNVNEPYISEIMQKLDVLQLKVEDHQLMNDCSPGGDLFMTKECIRAIGMENEEFVSHYFEDDYREMMLKKFGYKVERLPKSSPLYHLAHPLHPTANPNNHIWQRNRQIFQKWSQMSKEDAKRLLAL